MKALIVDMEKALSKKGDTYLRVRYVNEKKEQKSAVLFLKSTERHEDFVEAFKGKICSLQVQAGDPSDKIEVISALKGEDITPYIKTTRLNVKTMLDYLHSITHKDELLSKIVDFALFSSTKRLERFSIWPAAASYHHAFQGGLIEHTYAMAKIAEVAATVDPALEGIDMNVVQCAVLLHDVAKVMTYEFIPGTAAAKNNYDVLLGHITLADETIVRACVTEKLHSTQGAILNLRHCVLSHHGKKDWGSPVVPSTREAVFLHQLDALQSRNEMAREATESLESGTRSVYLKTIDTEMVKF